MPAIPFQPRLSSTKNIEKRKSFMLFGIACYSCAEWVVFILALIGISFTTFTVVFQNEEFFASTTITNQIVKEEQTIASTSSFSTVTERTSESGSNGASAKGDTSQKKDKFKIPYEKYEGIPVNEQNLNTDDALFGDDNSRSLKNFPFVVDASHSISTKDNPVTNSYRGVTSRNKEHKSDGNPTIELAEKQINPLFRKTGKSLGENHFTDSRQTLDVKTTASQDGTSKSNDAEKEYKSSFDKLSEKGINSNNIQGFSPDILEELDVNYDYEIDVSGLPDKLWDYYDDKAFKDIIDVETKQERDYKNTKSGYDNIITNFQTNKIRTKSSYDIVDLDTFKEEDDWDENEKSEYADMSDVHTHIDFEDVDDYDEYDEFYVDRQNSLLNMIDTDTHNEEDKNGFNHWSKVDDAFKKEGDWNENDEKSEYADMIDVHTHIDFEDEDDYDEYDEFYVDRQNSLLNMIDTDTHNEEDENGVNHWSQVDGERNRNDEMIDVTTFDENEVFDSEKWMYKNKDVSSNDMIDTDTFEEQVYNDEDNSDEYCLDYDDNYSYDIRSWDYSDMIDLGTKAEKIDILDEDESEFYDMKDTEAYREGENKIGVKKERHTSDFNQEFETKVEKMIRALKEVEL